MLKLFKIRRYGLGLALLQASLAFSASGPSPELPKDAVPSPAVTYTFERDALEKFPTFLLMPQADRDRGENWLVQRVPDAPSLPQALVHKSSGLSRDSSALALFQGPAREYGEIAVRFKTLSTDGDQIAGVVFRYVDADNYWIFALNTRDDSGSLFQVKGGKRKLINTQEAIIAPFRWHVLNLVFTEGNYTALLNQQLLLGGKTKRVNTPGAVGLFCASNSSVAFDDFRITR